LKIRDSKLYDLAGGQEFRNVLKNILKGTSGENIEEFMKAMKKSAEER